MPRSRIAGSYGSSTLVFKKPAYCSPQCLYQFTFPPKVWEGSLLPTPSPAFIIFRLFDDAHPDWCEVIHHCSFDLHFSNSDVEHLFMCFLAIYISSLEKCLFRSFTHTFLLCCLFFYIELHEPFVYFGLISCWSLHLQIFSPIRWVVFLVFSIVSMAMQKL